MMDWKEIIKPTKGKLILPVLLVLLFLVLVILNYSLMHRYGSFGCVGMKEYSVPIIKAYSLNDTETAQKIDAELQAYRKEHPDIAKSTESFLTLSNFVFKKINPWHVRPCLFEEEDCTFSYLREDDFNCLKSNLKEISELGKIGEWAKSVYENFFYKPIPVYYFILGFLILFLEGYVVSCLIALTYKAIKRKL